MNKWNPLCIGELIDAGKADLQTGPFGTQLNAGEYIEHGIPVVNVRNIGFGKLIDAKLEYLSDSTADRLNVHRLEKDDLVFCRKGAVERHLLVPQSVEGWIQGSDCMRLRLKSKDVSARYLSYYFSTAGHKDWMEAQCSFGSTMSSLNQGVIRRINISLPPLPVQRKIAAILSAYDDLIENNTRRIALLEKMAEEVYREWFVRLRFPGHERVPVHQGVPEGWELKPVGELLEYYIGGGWGEEEPSSVHHRQAYVIRGTDIPKVRLNAIDSCPLRYHALSNFQSRQLKSDDIVFEVSGGSAGQPVGRTLFVTAGLLKSFQEDVICASFCKLLRPNRNAVEPTFFYQCLRTLYDYGVLDQYQVQSTGITNFKFEGFLSLEKVLVPLKSVQEEYTNLSEPLFAEISVLGRENGILCKTRDMLLSRLLSGKIDVEPLDIRFPAGMSAAEY